MGAREAISKMFGDVNDLIFEASDEERYPLPLHWVRPSFKVVSALDNGNLDTTDPPAGMHLDSTKPFPVKMLTYGENPAGAVTLTFAVVESTSGLYGVRISPRLANLVIGHTLKKPGLYLVQGQEQTTFSFIEGDASAFTPPPQRRKMRMPRIC